MHSDRNKVNIAAGISQRLPKCYRVIPLTTILARDMKSRVNGRGQGLTGEKTRLSGLLIAGQVEFGVWPLNSGLAESESDRRHQMLDSTAGKCFILVR